MGRPTKDRTGERYGRLTCLKHVGSKHKSALWECVCDCGNVVQVTANHLHSGGTSSCGCFLENKVEHGKRLGAEYGGIGIKEVDGSPSEHHPLYRTWCRMKERCHNPKHIAYHRYGGRGIAVCDSWKDSFEIFVKDMGERPEGCTLDRIDNNGGYSPDNCRWATAQEQALNRG